MCSSISPVVATEPASAAYRDLLATFGAGTFDDALTVHPPEHLQTWADRMGNLMTEADMPVALRDLVVFADDIDGRMLCFDATGVVLVDGFEPSREELAPLVDRLLAVEGRRTSWFRPRGKHVLVHAEALVADATVDAWWVRTLVDGDDTRLLALLDGQVVIREVHLPALDGVLRLQVVGTRCSLRLLLPRDADGPGALRSLDAPAAWRPLIEGARTTVLG